MDKRILVVVFGVLLAAPILGLAAVTSPNLWPTGYWGGGPTAPGGGLVSCTGNPYSDFTTKPPTPNPNFCKSITDLIQTFVNVVYFGITLALFVFAPISFAIGGVLILTAGGSPLEVLTGGARGNPQNLSMGKKIISSTVWGVVIVLGAFVIVRIFIWILGIKEGVIGGFGL